MSLEEQNTEQRILDAAESVFVEEGFAGARMQEIADRAGINKAMLHYYFRSKDKLFEVIFMYKMGQFLPKVMTVLHDDSIRMVDKIDLFVMSYLSMLRKNPFLPLFVITATNRNPDLGAKLRQHTFGVELMAALEKSIERGEIRQVNVHQFALTLMGMCIFPFVGRHVFKNVMDLTDAQYNELIADRHLHVMQYVRAILSK